MKWKVIANPPMKSKMWESSSVAEEREREKESEKKDNLTIYILWHTQTILTKNSTFD